MKLVQPANLLLAALCAFSSTVAHAAWNLDSEKSSVNFVSIKKDSIGEVHRFKDVAGTLSQTGEFMLDIDLTSVDTGIEIRDERMQESFFDVMNYPLAMAKGRVDAQVLDSLKEGEVTPATANLSLTLHGATAELSAKLNAVKLSDDTLWVTSAVPVIVDTNDFDLAPGVDKLKALAGLDSISYAVPLTVNLLFNYAESAPATEQ